MTRTCRTPCGLVNVASAIFAAGMPCADSSTIWARRQVTTDPCLWGRSAAGVALVIVDLPSLNSVDHADQCSLPAPIGN
ncbi:hypothetical protein [Micromonospora sp. KC606]|uniref:hypothetical protein n=1 Tax=Micromonospora sp. KC606 TaxID=2530379 RepID=UPI0014050C84|nr:hypothetical protein [Micromonospora sp. KC606]